jgi:N-acetylglutamate synthase-like GNAT family acetyltransferase
MIEIIKVKNNEQLEIVNSICREVFADEKMLPAKVETGSGEDRAVNVLAIVNGEPAGCGRLIPMGEYAVMDNVAVRGNFRRMGIGTGICKLLIALAEDSMARNIKIKTNADIAGFFMRLGFEKADNAVLSGSSKDDSRQIEMTKKV